MWEQPEAVVVSSYDLGPMRRALSSKKLLPGYRWDPRWTRNWYRFSPRSARLFRLYDDLLHQRGPYRLARTFSIPVNVSIEFPPPEIRIYRKSDEPSLPRNGETQRGADSTLGSL